MPTSPYRVPRPALVFLFVAAALGGCIDYAVAAIPIASFSVATVQRIAVFFLLAALLASDRAIADPRRLRRFGIIILVSLALMYLLHDLADHVKRRQVIAMLGRQQGLGLWLVSMWMGAALLGRTTPAGACRAPWLRGAVATLMAYDTFCLVAAASSVNPNWSIYSYGWERGLLFAPLLGWVRAAEDDLPLRRQTAAGVLCWLGMLTVVSVSIAALDVVAGPELQRRLVDAGLVYLRGADGGPQLPERRVLFPMLDFNRTAYFALTALFSFLAAAFSPPRLRAQRPVLLLLAGLAFAVIFFTHTRGILIAAAAGLLLFGALRSRKLAVAGLLILVCGVAFMPSASRRHLLSIFQPGALDYREGRLDSVQARLIAFEFGIGAAADSPLTGLGYGTNIVRDAYRGFEMSPAGDPRVRAAMQAGQPTVHLHNVWLETAVESGVPAALALLAFTLIRWRMLLAAYWASRNSLRLASFVGLELALLIAGLGFYMLKKNSGMLTWYLWLFIMLEAASALYATGSKTSVGAQPE